MSDQAAVALLFFVPIFSVALFVPVRRKRRRDWAWHRVVDYAEQRTEASGGLPKDANDALVALFQAAAEGDVDRLQDTRILGVPVNVHDAVGQTPLMVAAANRGSAAGMRWLIEAGANVNAADALGETALLKAARVGSVEVVSVLLESGAVTQCLHVEGWTPLIVASLRGEEQVVQVLLESGAERAARVHGKTALAIAQQQGHSGVVALLQEGTSDA